MILLSEYSAEITSRIEREKESLASGSAKNLEDYAKKVGMIAGMRASLQLLHDIVNKKPKEERGL